MDRGEEGLDIYLEELRRIPLLTAEEQFELACKAWAGDAEARDELISRNLRFVVSVAKKYRASKVPLADIIQAGNLGLTIAAKKFDPWRGVKFTSFAVHRIRGQILLCLEKQRSTIRIPIDARNLLVEIEQYRESFAERFGRFPSDEEVAKNLHIRVETVSQLQISDSISSLDDPLSQERKVERYELIPDKMTLNPEELYIRREERKELLRKRQLVLDILASIPARKSNHKMHERNVSMFVEYYGLDGSGTYPTMQEIGDAHGITREAVRQKIEHLFQRVQESIGLTEARRAPAGNRSRTVWRGSAGTGLLG